MDLLTNGFVVAIIAHVLIGASLVWDKILLRQPQTKNLANYVFWLGAMSVFGLALIPFGFQMPSLKLAALAFGAGVIHLAANWFYYRALKFGEASQSIAVVGGFSPLATALIAIGLLEKPLGGKSLIGFSLLVAGGFVMFASEKLNWRMVLPSVLWSAGLFGVTNVAQKLVFDKTNFVSGYVFFTLGTFAGALGLLARACWRHEIFQHSKEATPRRKFWYFVNRFMSGVGSFLIFYSISKTSPAIVDAVAGLRYVLVFGAAYAFTRIRPAVLNEDFRRPVLIGKSVATGLVVAGLAIIGFNGRDTAAGAG